ncbi:biotin-dependent carboxyltransferase family protein [Nitriliruptoraceae bacterium ZYF776]|nr:biotin-dependent carboxyltransferase family protein [Profundirhabdus halotolerans]
MTGMLEVLATGPLSTVQDLGRPGYAHWGVTRSGAADRAAARLANRLVGNPEGAACLEVTFGGLRLRADADLVVALVGAPCPARVGTRPVPSNAPVDLPDGQELQLEPPDRGLRTYVAVRGGLDVPAVLGSRATDLLGQLGPEVLVDGDTLAVGNLHADYPPVEQAAVRGPSGGEVQLRIRWGPRHDRFTGEARSRLLADGWAAGQDSNRIGVRLRGPELPRSSEDELPSEGLVRGAIQVPPSGPPTLFLADHPVTGGYPVIATVLDDDVDLAAQVRPGQRVRFRDVGAPSDRERGSPTGCPVT